MRLRQSLILYCLICLALLTVVYKQLPEDHQSKSKIYVPYQQQGQKQNQTTTNRYFGKIVRDLFNLHNVSKVEFQVEREIQKELKLISNKVSNNELLLKEISSMLGRIDRNNHEIKQHPEGVVNKVNKDHPLYKVHVRVYNKMSSSEIEEFYDRERVSATKYGSRVLNPVKDRQILMTLFPGPDESRDRVTDQLYVKLKDTGGGYKTIFVARSGVNTQRKFDNDKCNVNKCIITSNPKYAPTADAVYMEHKMENKYLNSNKNPNQVTVVFQLESARNYPSLKIQNLPGTSTQQKRTLNWTASYRTDSVLNTPYERFTPFLNATRLAKKPLENYARGKSKMAAWFVSNCYAASGRNNYINELKKHIPVDIYGRCGKSCPKRNMKCFEQLNTDYRFYLSFENSNCKDYITEKVFWNGLRYRVIPVVFGAHYEEYKRALPPNSFIHVDQFKSPKKLADYLIFLSHNDNLYNQYFLWKDTGRFINTKFMCRLCTMVHLAPHFPMWYSDANRWWRSRDTCVDPTKDNDGVSYGTWKHKQPAKQHVDFVRYGYKRSYKN